MQEQILLQQISNKNAKLAEFIWRSRHLNIKIWTDKLKWHGKHCVNLHTILCYMLEFRKRICSFCINVYDRSYISGSTNQIYDKRVWRSNNATQTWNMYKNFSITFKRGILSMCCTKSDGACWDKDDKHASSSAKMVSRYLCWDSIDSKRISCVRTQYKEDNIFIWCCVLKKVFLVR